MKQNVSLDWESLGAPAGARLKGIGSTPTFHSILLREKEAYSQP